MVRYRGHRSISSRVPCAAPRRRPRRGLPATTRCGYPHQKDRKPMCKSPNMRYSYIEVEFTACGYAV